MSETKHYNTRVIDVRAQIEARFDFSLPDAYRTLSHSGAITTSHAFPMPTGLRWWSLSRIVEYERGLTDAAGFVPFADNEAGDLFAWWPEGQHSAGTPVVLLSPGGSATVLAPSFAGFLYERILFHAAFHAKLGASEQHTRAFLRAWATAYGPILPIEWHGVLEWLLTAPQVEEAEFSAFYPPTLRVAQCGRGPGAPSLLSCHDLETLLRRDLAYPDQYRTFLWRTKSGRPPARDTARLTSLDGWDQLPDRAVVGVAPLPGMKQGISATRAGAVQLIELPSGRPLRRLADVSAGLTTATPLPDNRIACAGADGQIRIVEIASGASRSLKSSGMKVVRLIPVPGGTHLLSFVADGSVDDYDTMSDRPALSTQLPAEGAHPVVEALVAWFNNCQIDPFTRFQRVAVVPDWTALVLIGPGQGTLLHYGTQPQAFTTITLPSARPYPVAPTAVTFTPSTTQVAIATDDGMLGLFDGAGGNRMASARLPFRATAIAALSESQFLIGGAHGQILRFDLAPEPEDH
ncbi:MAG: hypothetical protein ACLQVD_06570 [Capsulimonadaceae bacterium]